jgi:hypothetical protein
MSLVLSGVRFEMFCWKINYEYLYCSLSAGNDICNHRFIYAYKFFAILAVRYCGMVVDVPCCKAMFDFKKKHPEQSILLSLFNYNTNLMSPEQWFGVCSLFVLFLYTLERLWIIVLYLLRSCW